MLAAQMRFYLKIICSHILSSNQKLSSKTKMLPAPSCPVQVSRVMERVEHAFVKHFANGNHRKGMNILRPTAKRERHRITFLLGKGQTPRSG